MTPPLPELSAALADRYELERELGHGAMATVYLARDLRHGRKVAVKVLRPELAAVLGAERFLQEIEVTAHLQHPRILALFDSGNANGSLFYVMPYVDGQSLRDRLTEQKQLPVDEAVKIALAVASALEYAHRHGVIHRDIKPENILLQDGEPVVADFGIALALSHAGGKRLTETGLSLGTPQYMSPEQATGDREIDARTDVYALGATTYEMLVGEPPHLGNSTQAIVAKIISDDPAPITRARPIVPPNVDAAVRTALAKTPADRFSSAAAFASALTNPAFTMQTRGAAGGDSTSHTAWKRLSGMLAVALSAMVGLSLWGWLRPAARSQWPVSRYALSLADNQALMPALAPRVAVSPNGARFVYVGPGDGGTQLWLRERNQLVGTPLVGTDGAVQPAFSPDGRQVAFLTFAPTPSLKIVALDGRPPVTVASVVGSHIESGGVAWGSDNLLYVTGAEGLARVSARGGTLEPVTHLDGVRRESKHVWPDVLPNARGVLFTVRHALGANEVAVVDLKTRSHRTLVPGTFARYATSGHLVYVTGDGTLLAAPFDAEHLKLTGASTPLADGVFSWGAADLALSHEGTLLYVAGGNESSTQVVRVTRDGAAKVIDPTWQGDIGSLALSPDGRRLAVGIREGGRSDVWIKQLDTGPMSRLTFGDADNFRPAWMADGRRVTYMSDRAGQQDLWVQPADGSAGAQRLLDSERNISEGFVSPDGGWIIFRTNIQDAGRGDVLARRVVSDTAMLRLAATDDEEVMPALSPDERWLAYVSNESGQRQIYVRPFPNANQARWQVSIEGGNEPLWSHTGRELFYRDAAGYLVAVKVRSAPTFAVLERRSLFGTMVYRSEGTHAQYAPAPDDQSFLMIRRRSASGGNALIIVENLFDELRTKARK